MRNIIKYNHAISISLFIIGLLGLVHLSIVIGIVAFDFVPDFIWGGKVKTVDDLLYMELISLLMTPVLFFIVLMKTKKFNLPKLKRLSTAGIWIMVVLFLVNTIGNLIAETNFEKLFAIISGVLALLLLRIALEKDRS